VAVLTEARRLVADTDDMRAALIEALSRRYSTDPQADRATLNGAYAAAMEAVQGRFPEDADVALLTADALVNLTSWIIGATAGARRKARRSGWSPSSKGCSATGSTVRSPPIPITPARSISTSTLSTRRTGPNAPRRTPPGSRP
jgi:hypothetical protein